MTFTRETEFITVQDDLYQVLRKFKETTGPVVDKWKEYLDADKAFRIGDEIVFCRLVQDAIIDDTEVILQETNPTGTTA